MSIWGIVVFVGVLIIVALVIGRGKADRAARRELRRLRHDEKRVVNDFQVAERQRDVLWLSHLPGKNPPPGTF
jgi:hypothetical protein